jgi:MFS superfamily sulfate permease-like transporter
LIEKLLSNPAVIGVIGVVIGACLSLFGTILSQIILFRKEQKQWENQHNAENNLWIRNEQKKEKEYLREIYQNSLRSLSLFVAIENQKEEEKNKEQQLESIDEIHKWVTMLLLRHSSSNLDKALNSFTSWPSESRAIIIRKEIIDLSKSEEGFFINELRGLPEKIKEYDQNPDIRFIQISIDNNFREQQLIEGVELPQQYKFELKLSEMSKSQREKLSECYFQSYKTIPNRFSLVIPVEQNGTKQNKQWQAKLNPISSQPQEILNSWETDFEKCSKGAELTQNNT